MFFMIFSLTMLTQPTFLQGYLAMLILILNSETNIKLGSKIE